MRRAVARGRVFPQSYSTDRRYGRLSLKAGFLYPMMWANADDQGRLCGDPEEIKYAVCPNVDHITKQDIPGLLQELQDDELILCYTTPKSAAIQMLDWWEVHHPQWAWPSDYLPPEGWQDHLRYKKDAKTVCRLNWPVSGEDNIVAQVSEAESSGESSGETISAADATPPHPEIEPENETGNRRGRRNSPEDSGEKIATTTPLEGKTTGEEIPRSESEVEESLCEGDREVISVWCSVKGFTMSPADASALVASLRIEFPDVDILAESKAWAARKLSEPLKPTSRPSGQIWNRMRLARQFAQERRARDGTGIQATGTGGRYTQAPTHEQYIRSLPPRRRQPSK